MGSKALSKRTKAERDLIAAITDDVNLATAAKLSKLAKTPVNE